MCAYWLQLLIYTFAMQSTTIVILSIYFLNPTIVPLPTSIHIIHIPLILLACGVLSQLLYFVYYVLCPALIVKLLFILIYLSHIYLIIICLYSITALLFIHQLSSILFHFNAHNSMAYPISD